MPVLSPFQADRAQLSAAEQMPRGDPFLIRVGLLTAAVVVVLDQATKELAEGLLVRGRMVPVLGEGWGFQLTYNPGGAFGFLAPSWFFLVVTVVVAVIVVRNLPHVTTLSSTVAYGLLMAGALGNALDRVFRPGDPGDPRFLHGHVVDFVAIELPFYGAFPRFNLADVAITCGFVLLLLAMWRDDRERQRGHVAAAAHRRADGT